MLKYYLFFLIIILSKTAITHCKINIINKTLHNEHSDSVIHILDVTPSANIPTVNVTNINIVPDVSIV